MISLILGAIVSFLPHLAFRYVFFNSDVTAPRQIVNRFYLGAILKFTILILLCSLALSWPKLQVTEFCLAFLLSGLIRWLHCLFNFPRIIAK